MPPRSSPPASAKHAHLDEAIAQADATRDAVVRDFGDLGSAALNWKSAPDRWSVAQCLEHLITSNESYRSVFQAVAEGTYRPTLAARIPLLPRVFAPLVRAYVTPDSRLKAKTTHAFEPAASAFPVTIVDDFRESVDALSASIDRLGGVDHERVIVTSPFAAFVCYRLRDAVLIPVLHLERHRLQAVRVTEHEGFPRSASDE